MKSQPLAMRADDDRWLYSLPSQDGCEIRLETKPHGKVDLAIVDPEGEHDDRLPLFGGDLAILRRLVDAAEHDHGERLGQPDTTAPPLPVNR